ncbi:MAG: hypothetical protein HETSPECPRED_000327 [Heterodermia speciosa]|uniref:Uncharacterized protein n=1 Tax=Heterodermia speciosa TaxID=116794 RepID=A0A8H3ETJ5_9LECA|nr:MAG: hypothetical protein HETSPECPRED_000327 [Heterodermia speciosa]
METGQSEDDYPYDADLATGGRVTKKRWAQLDTEATNLELVLGHWNNYLSKFATIYDFIVQYYHLHDTSKQDINTWLDVGRHQWVEEGDPGIWEYNWTIIVHSTTDAFLISLFSSALVKVDVCVALQESGVCEDIYQWDFCISDD